MEIMTRIRIIATTDSNGVTIPEVPKTPVINLELSLD
jgi:hypothetical protein